jgi:sulfide:quinone oxidoreductase
MSFQTLSADFSVAGQITLQDLSAIAKAGFKSILCNRPDGEAAVGQPTFSEVEMAALNEGLQVRYLPVVPGQITPDQGVAMAGLLAQLPSPVLAYCRSGARSIALWQLAQIQGQAG